VRGCDLVLGRLLRVRVLGKVALEGNTAVLRRSTRAAGGLLAGSGNGLRVKLQVDSRDKAGNGWRVTKKATLAP